MNYFEIFDIPVSLEVDKKDLSKKYFSLQKQYHPDFYGNSTSMEKDEALEKSALVNKAYKTFQSSDETMKYVLEMEGLLNDDEKYELPPLFLMEVMELNEMKMDGAEPDDILSRSNALQQEIYSEVAPIIQSFNEGQTSKEDLLKVKSYYYKKKYLDRLVSA